MALPLIPIIIAGARFLIPAAAKAGLKKLAKSSGATAAQTAAKKIAQTSGNKLTGAAARKAGRTPPKRSRIKINEKPTGSRVNQRKQRRVNTAKENPVGTATVRTKSGQLKTVSKKRVQGAKKNVKDAKVAKLKKVGTGALTAANVAALAKVAEDNLPKGKLGKVNVPVKPKTIEKAKIDELKSVKRATKTSQEAKERSSVKTAKKKRDRLFGLDFLPEIDSKKGGDKVNLPFGLGSYTTLPQEEETSMNKQGGSIKRQGGGRMRKAGCKRGMGKALRGY
jgi:hypothetical protein